MNSRKYKRVKPKLKPLLEVCPRLMPMQRWRRILNNSVAWEIL